MDCSVYLHKWSVFGLSAVTWLRLVSFFFSLCRADIVITVRFASGIIVILYENHPSVGLTIATIILLNAGTFPLIVATLGLVRIM